MIYVIDVQLRKWSAWAVRLSSRSLPTPCERNAVPTLRSGPSHHTRACRGRSGRNGASSVGWFESCPSPRTENLLTGGCLQPNHCCPAKPRFVSGPPDFFAVVRRVAVGEKSMVWAPYRLNNRSVYLSRSLTDFGADVNDA